MCPVYKLERLVTEEKATSIPQWLIVVIILTITFNYEYIKNCYKKKYLVMTLIVFFVGVNYLYSYFNNHCSLMVTSSLRL